MSGTTTLNLFPARPYLNVVFAGPERVELVVTCGDAGYKRTVKATEFMPARP